MTKLSPGVRIENYTVCKLYLGELKTATFLSSWIAYIYTEERG